MLSWIKRHPQRTAGLALSMVGAVQTNLALFQVHVSSLVYSGITTALGILVTVLAWLKTNTKDDSDPGQPAI